jgi:hypothetical protein
MSIEKQHEPGQNMMERVQGYVNDGQMNVDLMIHDLIAALKGAGFDEIALHERVSQVWPAIEISKPKVN